MASTRVQPQVQQAWLDPGPLAGHGEDRAFVFRPRLGVIGGPAMIWCHGAGVSALQGVTAYPSAFEFIGRLCALGVTVVAPDMGDSGQVTGPDSIDPWGTATVTARIETWRQWMHANLPCDASKVTVLGFSMGGSTSLSYASDYRSKVLAVSNWNSCWDVKTIRDNRSDPTYPKWGTDLAPLIDDAYELDPSDPLPAGRDLAANTALNGLKWRGYYATSGDVYVPPAWSTRMAAWTGGEAIPTEVTSHSPETMSEPSTPFDEWCHWAGVL